MKGEREGGREGRGGRKGRGNNEGRKQEGRRMDKHTDILKL